MVTMCDTRTALPVSHITGPYISGDTLDVRDSFLLTGSYRCKDPLEIWDMRVGERLHNIPWSQGGEDEGFIMACKFDQHANNVIAASSKLDDFKIIEVGSNDVKHEIKDIMSPTYAIDVTESASTIAFGTKQGDVNILKWKEIQDN